MINLQKHYVHYGTEVIEFVIEWKNVKNVNLNIKPDMTVAVSANDKVPLSFIYDFVKGKADWILKNVNEFQRVQPFRQSEREYVSGESFRYLGKQYRLKVVESDFNLVKYYRGFIYLHVNEPANVNRKAKLIDGWYKDKADKIFNKSLETQFPMLEKYGVEKPAIAIRHMKARWGSALLNSKTILLNTELIKAPKHCIDYVILHELVHFKYNDHSENFYNMLYSFMPDWEKRKVILDEEIVREI